jgi:uncharacterized protein
LLVATLLLSTFISVFTYAQEATNKLESTFEKHIKTLSSTILNEQRTVTVQLPKSYHLKLDKKYPVIYRLDGAENLPLMTEVLQRLHGANAAPEVIIVAIENTDRLKDFYHTENTDPRGPVGLGGGASKFLEFIEDELIPFVNSKYRTHDFKIIAGASAGGAFALYALQTKPELFQAHMAYSPAVWWDYGASAKTTKAFLSRTKSLNNFVYMNIGEESGFMREIYDDMNQFMLSQKPEGLTVISDSFDYVPHGLTSVAGIFNAYQNLFLPLWMPPRKYTGKTSSITSYYQQLSEQYGEAISPPEWVVRELGYYFVNNNDLESAIVVFKFDITLYPDSADAYNGLAYGYEKNGQLKDSLEQVNKALSLSKEGDDGYDVYVRRKERLMQKMKQEG